MSVFAVHYPVEIQALWIPGRLPGLNEIIDAAGTRKGTWNAYMSMKQKWGLNIATHARGQGFAAFEHGHFTYLFQEPNHRRDPSNVIAGGVKLIEDALQEAGLLKNDGWGEVLSIRPYYLVNANGGAAETAGVSLFITQDEPLSFEEAVHEHDKNRRKATPRGRK